MKRLFFFLLLVGILWGEEKNLLLPTVGFVGTRRHNVLLCETPGGRVICSLPVLQSVDIVESTNILGESTVETWYKVTLQSMGDEGGTVLKGWVKGLDLFSERDFQFVKKISEWYLLVKYSDFLLVFHVLPNGLVRCYENGEMFEERLKVYDAIFFLGRTMMYYDGKNPPYVPWAKSVGLITNTMLFPREEDLRWPLLRPFVVTGDRVNLRQFPSTNAMVFLQLKKGSEVSFLWRVGKPQKIAGKQGFWARVIVPGMKPREGYVFDAYLEEKR